MKWGVKNAGFLYGFSGGLGFVYGSIDSPSRSRMVHLDDSLTKQRGQEACMDEKSPPQLKHKLKDVEAGGIQ